MQTESSNAVAAAIVPLSWTLYWVKRFLFKSKFISDDDVTMLIMLSF